MIPLHKMPHKRGKMLFWVTLFTLVITECACINLTYIVKKEGRKLQHNCIADENERYAAIGWVYPTPETEDKLPNITTKFIPHIANAYNCKFSKNDKCNNIWKIKNWEIDGVSTRTFDLIFDSRWEDFPTIFTGNSTEFKDRVEIPNIFRVGFSLRAPDTVELLICEGWDPHKYPCYHLNMTKTRVFLLKNRNLSKDNASSEQLLDTYEGFGGNILSGDEWRNFIVNLDDKGELSLYDVSLNRTVIQYTDKEVLKPLYLIVRSSQPTLWKIHQNQFIYTKTPQISRLGPVLNLPSKDLCLSFYVSTCELCFITFFMLDQNKQKKILLDVEPTKELQWQLVKLKAYQIMSDKLNIFVETKFIDDTESDGFWAIDDVRVCHENEVKVTFLKVKEKDDGDISCQVVEHPKWRPQKLVYSKIKDFPTIESWPNSSSISLNWTQEDPNNQINYFITYQANDLCPAEPFNLRRIKSNGFLMTKFNEITIDNLVPYTKYNITFSSMLHENENNITVTTVETEVPTPEEYPSKLQIHTTDSQAYVSWDKVDCTSIYGPIVYSMQITNHDTNMLRELNIQTDNAVEINDLQPYTPYTFTIGTSRSFENIRSNQKTIRVDYNFTTKAGMAPPIVNVEVYTVDKNSASIRYDLPKKAKGVPAQIEMTKCNPITFKKCRSTIQDIAKCKLWPQKYCFDIDNLIPNQKYNFGISIRNKGTIISGEEVKVNVITTERIPAPPTNITYRMVDCQGVADYCHLNLSWLHPYDQNGTITSFNIVLNRTESDNTSISIHEILSVTNKTYWPRYYHQIPNVPYSTRYELYVQSVNLIYKSDFAHVQVKTDDLGDHINQEPTLMESNGTSVIFKLPSLDPRLKSYTLTTAVQDFNNKEEVPRLVLRAKKVAENLCHQFGNTWILPSMDISTNGTHTITIGTENGTNKYLKPGSQYCITFIITNKYRNTEHDVVYYKKLTTSKLKEEETKTTTSGANHNHLYVLLLLLLLVPIGFLVYRYVKKRRRRRSKQPENPDNVYESLPFEECEENCVQNETYDQLLHK